MHVLDQHRFIERSFAICSFWCCSSSVGPCTCMGPLCEDVWSCVFSQQSVQINLFYTYCVCLTFQRRQLEFRPLYRQRRCSFQVQFLNSCREVHNTLTSFLIHLSSLYMLSNFSFSFDIIKPSQLAQHIPLLRSHASRNMTSSTLSG
jgi:hypothetical protein